MNAGKCHARGGGIVGCNQFIDGAAIIRKRFMDGFHIVKKRRDAGRLNAKRAAEAEIRRQYLLRGGKVILE